MAFETPKGISDVWFDDVKKRKWVYSKIDSTLQSYGYASVEPSPIEYLETLTAKSGPEIEKEIYAFEDKKGEKLALRFDLTVGIARMMASKQLPLPARLCSIGSMWRYDNPQHGRYRWFWQWDAELFGAATPQSDAEIIALTCDILESVGLKDYSIRINSRTLVEAFLKSIDVKSDNVIPVMRVLDKFHKLSPTDFESELKKSNLNDDQIKGINKHLEIVGTVINGENEEIAKEESDSMAKVFDLLESYGCKDKCFFDPSVMRGLDYYNGVVFEAVVKGEESAGSIAGGGRFDGLVGIFGKDTPAIGVAGGIERLMMSLQKQEMKIESNLKVGVLYVNDSVLNDAIKISQELRKSRINALMDVQGRNLRDQLDFANKYSLDYVIIVGPKDLAEKCVTLRQMQSGEESKVPISDIISKLK